MNEKCGIVKTHIVIFFTQVILNNQQDRNYIPLYVPNIGDRHHNRML